ncbi:hypothetical protein Sros01_42830 [Streptomyces roseochromogenus]|nr:hypothetical protein Sros01_42830 [Streptomyces roseochromogenus]
MRVVVREAAPRNTLPVHVEDRVRQASEVVVGRSDGVQAAAAARGPPCGQDRLGQFPPGIGQIAGYWRRSGMIPGYPADPGARSPRRESRHLGMKQEEAEQGARLEAIFVS